MVDGLLQKTMLLMPCASLCRKSCKRWSEGWWELEGVVGVEGG